LQDPLEGPCPSTCPSTMPCARAMTSTDRARGARKDPYPKGITAGPSVRGPRPSHRAEAVSRRHGPGYRSGGTAGSRARGGDRIGLRYAPSGVQPVCPSWADNSAAAARARGASISSSGRPARTAGMLTLSAATTAEV